MRTKVALGFDWLLVLGLCLFSSVGFAQQNDQLQFPAVKASLDCMLPLVADRGAPSYPAAQLADQMSSTVKVKLTFTSPDTAPKVEFLGIWHNAAFEDAVERHVRRYRLPCFVLGQAPIEALQQFDFKYGDDRPVVYSDLANSARNSYSSCVASSPPNYPQAASQTGQGGNIILQITFLQRDAAPDVKVIYGGRNRWLEEAAVDAAKKYRFNCVIPAGEPLVAKQQFNFRIEDGKNYTIRDLGLVQFLGIVDRSGLGRVRFDLNTMGCPFDLNVALYRPYAANVIGEFDTSDPSRKEFIKWLSQLTMQFPRGSEQYLIGKSLKVAVPCMVIDLT